MSKPHKPDRCTNAELHRTVGRMRAWEYSVSGSANLDRSMDMGVSRASVNDPRMPESIDVGAITCHAIKPVRHPGTPR